MQHRTSFLLLLIPALLLTAACNRKVAGPAVGAGAATGKLRVAQVLRAVEENRNTAEWMDAKARVNLDSEKLNIGGTAVIRLHRDEAIWMSVKKFGFEGARALIRPDSFFLSNRLSGDYIAEPLSYIEEKYKIPARFDLLQEIFFGNAVFLTEKLAVDADPLGIRLTGRSDDFDTDYLIETAGYQLVSMNLQELGADRSLLVTNGDYEAVPGVPRPFPLTRRVSVDGGEKVGVATMELEFGEVEFGREVAMPYFKYAGSTRLYPRYPSRPRPYPTASPCASLNSSSRLGSMTSLTDRLYVT